MSDSAFTVNSDEDQYANDSFETEILESSVYESDGEHSEIIEKLPPSPSKEKESKQMSKLFEHKSDYWTCESSSDEDDVILGETVAEINTDPAEYDDDDEALTPAARLFLMASSTRNRQTHNSLATPATSKDDEDNDDNDDNEEDDLTECEDFEEENENKSLSSDPGKGKFYKNKYKDFSGHDMLEEDIAFEDGMEIDDIYTDVGIDDGGEVDIGDTNIDEELGEEEGEIQDVADDGTDDENGEPTDEDTAVPGSDDEATVVAQSQTALSIKEEWHSETKSLRTDDSMEDFKRRVMLSERMRCQSDGGGDSSNLRSRRSGIPVWVGQNGRSDRIQAGRSTKSSPGLGGSMIPVSDMRVPIRSSMSDLSDAETLTPTEYGFNENAEAEYDEKDEGTSVDRAAGGDYNEFSLAESYDGDSCAYTMEMEMFMKSARSAKSPKKLKAGERRNMSFTNDRLRDIERHNQILLRKILSQKPTYVIDEKKKKKDKFSSLPPTTRISSAEINRKKQQRQIDMDNQLLKRKLEAISNRKPKAKAL